MSLIDDTNTTNETLLSSKSQPGYRYGSVTMKARSYDQLPHTYQFTKNMERLYTRKSTTKRARTGSCHGRDTLVTPNDDTSVVFIIGAHILLYRDVHDSMGFHADNDQGESYILTTILSQQHGRDIIIKPKPSEPRTITDMRLETHFKLQLEEGDAYSMDGT